MVVRKRKVRVHLQDRVTTIEGVLVGRTRHDLVLWAPKVLDSDGEGHEVSGHVEIPRGNVLFKQVLG